MPTLEPSQQCKLQELPDWLSYRYVLQRLHGQLHQKHRTVNQVRDTSRAVHFCLPKHLQCQHR